MPEIRLSNNWLVLSGFYHAITGETLLGIAIISLITLDSYQESGGIRENLPLSDVALVMEG